MISQNLAKGETVEDRYAVETHVVGHAASCTLQINVHMTRDGQVQSQGSATVRLRDMTALAVKAQTHLINDKNAKMGVTGWNGKITPETYVLQIFRSGTLAGMFFFHDSRTADLVAANRTTQISPKALGFPR